MARERSVKDFSYQGLDLDYRPFDAEVFADILERTQKNLAVTDANRLDQPLEAMNTAAIQLDHDIQLGKAPSDTTEKQTLDGMLAGIRRLQPLFQVAVIRDHGLAPGDEPAVPYGVRKLLGAEIDRRLLLNSPITDWSWAVEDNPAPAPSNSPGFSHRDQFDLDAVTYTDEDDLSPASRRAPFQHRPSPDYDPARPELFFGADNADDILVVFSNLLALLEESAQEIQAQRLKAARAERATPERTFVFNLIPIYCELFGAEPASSVGSHTGTPGGPLIRFLSACLAKVEDRGAHHVKPETLRKYIAEYKQASRTCSPAP